MTDQALERVLALLRELDLLGTGVSRAAADALGVQIEEAMLVLLEEHPHPGELGLALRERLHGRGYGVRCTDEDPSGHYSDWEVVTPAGRVLSVCPRSRARPLRVDCYVVWPLPPSRPRASA